MYHALILTGIALLLSAGGWFDNMLFGIRKRWILYVFFFALLFAAVIPSIRIGSFSLYPAGVILLAAVLASQRTRHPVRLALLAAAAGLAGWQMIEWFPLFPLQGTLLILPALLLCVAVSETRGAKRILLAVAPYVAALCTALSDRFLFGYAVVPIGTETGMTATLLGILLLEIAVKARDAIAENKRERRKTGLPAKENPEI